MKITQIEVKKFRNLVDVRLQFSPRLNAIAGQNGTSKTSILGLIAHIFTYNKSYKTLSGKNFSTEFREIFRFAYPDFDKAGDHSWVTHFSDFDDVPAISYDRKETSKKGDIRIRVRESIKGGGKVNFPIIYLGMGRLFPLTLEDNIKSNISELTTLESKEFVDLHNEILLFVDEKVIPESISTSSKSFYAASTTQYNHLGNSAGQDNIGQIITALISFKRLQQTLGDKYEGGILLIDELDASLFPAAQIELVKKLYAKSMELNLQIFYTTHSLEVLSETISKRDSRFIYLNKNSGKILPQYDLDLDQLKKDLLVLGPDALKKINEKKFVYCEDQEAVEMLKNILPTSIKNKIEIFATKLGANVLKDIAKKGIPDFKKSIIVLDGDIPNSIPNVISLPGKHGPDRLIYDLLSSLEQKDFDGIKSGYTKQFCFKNLSSLSTSTDKSKAREKTKKWYLEQKVHWGRISSKVWKLWVSKNSEEVETFISKFQSLV